MAERRRWPLWRTITGALLVLIVLLLIFWDWNWFTPLVEREASARLHRKVTIGHMSLHLAWAPLLVLDNLTISDPPDDPAKGDLVSIDRFSIRIDAWKAYNGLIDIPEIAFDHPVVELHSYGKGQQNYAFTSGGTATSSEQPRIGELIVTKGDIHFSDPTLKTDFRLAVNTGEPGKDGERSIRVDANGTYSAQPISGRFIGGSVLSLRDDKHPYPIDLDARNGATHVMVKGTVKDPMSFGGANVTLDLEGDDLSKLFPLTGIPIPPSPKYRLRGALDVAGPYIRFKNFEGTVGSSDLEGNLDIAPGQERPFITADMSSKRVVLADLAGFIGNEPGGAHEAAATPQQRAAKQAEEANAPLLPTKPINLPQMRSADLKVHYVGKRIDSDSTPLDDIDAQIVVQDGTIRLEPLKFGVGQGDVAINLTLEGQKDLVHARGDIQVDHVDLRRIMQDIKPFRGGGIIGGGAKIDTTGNSLAAMLSNGNGDANLSMSGGDLSALLADLGGLEIGRAIYQFIGGEQTPVHCMVADVGLKQGVMSTRSFILDTGEENLFLGGTLDFRNQSLDLKLSSQAKHFSVLSVKAPIDITGSMKSPSIRPDAAALAKRGGPAAVLGVFLSPVASLLATIELGDGDETNCKDLVSEVKAGGKTEPAPAAPVKPPATKKSK